MPSDSCQCYADKHQWCRLKINDPWENRWYPIKINDMPTSIHDIGWKSMISKENQWHPITINDVPTSINDTGENQWSPESRISDGTQWYSDENQGCRMKINDLQQESMTSDKKSMIYQPALMTPDDNQWSPTRSNDMRYNSMICRRASMISDLKSMIAARANDIR